MKTIGLIGGMSWESTVGYYREINRGVNRNLGGLHSAQILLHSVDFAPIEQYQHTERWDKTAEVLCRAAQGLERAGADFFLICTNTMHKVAPEVQQAVDIPLLHIADATAEKISGLKRVGLLGTAFTMEQDFYRGRLEDVHGVEILVPQQAERKIVHDVIYRELCRGVIETASKNKYLSIIDNLRDQGAQGIILGCTEIGMLVKQRDTQIPLYDTTRIHALKAVETALDLS